ncbi:MAG: prephenate dehydratase [Gammaproteobacteria bacterium]|nr:prephenate dehydratase [Gammaproteobacteria bacterium]MDH5693232.1 prephenate dehydratase [Gammaproteobacteria bacterium]
MSSDQEKLSVIRDKIDKIDVQLQELISERAQCAMEVAEIKVAAGDTNFYKPEREAQILRAIKERNTGPLNGNDMARLFREIISACLALEQPMKIAFLGPEGTYTQSAAFKHFGHAVTGAPLAAIDEVFREVEAGSADYGVVPIENSTEGMVNQTLDMFARSPLTICGEVELRIHHQLLSKNKAIKDISKVFSHQQTFAQCREWLGLNLAGVEHFVVSSNSEAARLAAETKNSAAIAGEVAAEIYGLNILEKNIEDEPDNTTRFLVVGKQNPLPSGSDKTSLIIYGNNKPGSLYSILEPLSKNGVSMSRIESRPSRKGTWDYIFFIDLDGHHQDDKVAKALQEMKDNAISIKLLGSYPKALN